jgi:hypothetical protein
VYETIGDCASTFVDCITDWRIAQQTFVSAIQQAQISFEQTPVSAYHYDIDGILLESNVQCGIGALPT